jgi:hypothetical protein
MMMVLISITHEKYIETNATNTSQGRNNRYNSLLGALN